MTPFRLATLGRLELERDGAPVLARRRKDLGLLVFLARRGPRPVDRTHLAGMLWGASGQESRARASLRQALFDLREVVGDLIEADHESVRVDPRRVELDLAEFETAIAAGRLEQAVAVWGGPFLDGLENLGDESWLAWVESERAAATAKLIVALGQLRDFAAQKGDIETAIRWANRLRDGAPHDEVITVKLAELYLQSGRAADARAVVDRYTADLHRELGESPGAAMRGLMERLQQGGSRMGRALLSPELVGRDPVVAALAAAAGATRKGHGRSVILEGGSGSGKSRLAELLVADPNSLVGAAAGEGRSDGSRAGRSTDEPPSLWLGRAFAAERRVPWSTLRPVLARALTASPGVGAVPPEYLAAAMEAVPELRERFSVAPSTENPPVTDALVRVLSEMAAERPCGLVIDDAVEADDASVDVLVALARRPPPGLLLVLTGTPDGWATSALGKALTGATTVERLTLGPVTEEEIGRMLASMAPFDGASQQRLVARLSRDTDGRPGAIVQRVRALADAGSIFPGPAGIWEFRPDATDPGGGATAEPFDIPTATRRLAETAARLGPVIDPARLRSESGLPGAVHDEALGSALGLRILRQSAAHPGRFEFEHETTRQGLLDPGQRARRERRWRLAALAGVVVAGLALGGWLLRRPDPARVPAGTPILVATLRNDTGDPAFGALQTAAEVGLLETGHVWILPRARITAALRRAGRAGADSAIAGELARDVAARENVPLVLEFGVERLGTAFLVSGRVVAAATGVDLAAFDARAADADAVLDALGSVVRRIHRALGSVPPPDSAGGLPSVTTGSLSALRAYSAAEAAWNGGDAARAAGHLDEALALDSTFAMAHLLAARHAYRIGNDRAAATGHLAAATRFRDRLTAREQLALDLETAQVAGQADRAIDLAARLATRFPTPATVGSHANALFRAGRCQEALPVFRRAIGMAPGNTALVINLATCLQLVDSLEAALAAYADADRIDPSVLLTGTLNHEWGGAFVRLGRRAAAESVFRRMVARPPTDQARGLRSLGYLALTRGDYGSALRHFTEASQLFQREGVALSAIRSETMAAQAAARAGQPGEARARLARVATLAVGVPLDPVYPLYIGSTHLLIGDAAGARRWLARLDAIVGAGGAADSAIRRLLEARVALAEGHPERAAALLPVRWPAAVSQHAVAAQTTRGEVHWSLGHADSAIAVWQSTLGHHQWGYELQDEWERLPLRLAEAHLAGGDSAAARAVLAPLAERWRDAPASFPDLDRLTRLLGRLQPAGRR
ncbi:MAG: tetratricopeptide repeat protein [Gemmatimonadales bacterium]|nr:tetratricopeptide repeat protein [Gemmatimonadales bacterium]